jgi:transcriptional regulator with XRE-family HTH domain
MANFNRIKEVLAKKGVTSITLAVKLRVKPQTVSSWCTNRNQPPLATLFAIAEFLDVEPRELITERKDLRAPKKKDVPKKK